MICGESELLLRKTEAFRHSRGQIWRVVAPIRRRARVVPGDGLRLPAGVRSLLRVV